MSRSFLSILLLASAAQAGGFAVSTQSAAATGRGGAAAASRGPSAIYYNPAGLAGEAGVAVEAGGTVIAPKITATNPGSTGWKTAETNTLVSVPPTLYLAAALRRLAMGFGVFTPFGNSVQYPEDWPGRFYVTDISLRTFYFQPTAALRLADEWSVGAGLDLVRATVAYTTRANFIQTEGTVNLGGDAGGYGVNLGLRYEPMKDKLAFGLTWRSGVRLDFEGLADFQGVPLSFADRAPDQKVTTHLVLPDFLSAAVDYRPTPDLLLSYQLDYTTWSYFKEFAIDFESERTEDVASPRDWENTFTFRLGGEYTPHPMYRLRGGLVYDMQASPANTLSPAQPDSDRIAVSLGGAMMMGKASLDLGYTLVQFLGRKSEGPDVFPAEYAVTAHLVGVSLGYRL